MSEYVDSVFDGLRSISSFSEDLAAFSEAFETLGNSRMADEMIIISRGLRFAEERIRQAVAEDLNKRAGGS